MEKKERKKKRTIAHTDNPRNSRRLSEKRYRSLMIDESSLKHLVSRGGEKTSPRSLLEPSSHERREFSLYIGVNRGLDRESIARGFAGSSLPLSDG